MEGIPLDVLRLDQNLALQASCLYFLLFRCSSNLLRVNFKMTLYRLLRAMAMVFLTPSPSPHHALRSGCASQSPPGTEVSALRRTKGKGGVLTAEFLPCMGPCSACAHGSLVVTLLLCL